MNLLIFLHPADAPGLSALLGRMHVWGQLNWYDMDAIFKNVEEPAQRMYFLFPLPGFDWRVFAELFHRLMNEGTGAITRADGLSFIVMGENFRRTHSLPDFFAAIEKNGTP
jgi:hypothetical protein